MSSSICYLNPTPLPEVKTDEGASNKYSIQTSITKGTTTETSVIAGQATQDEVDARRDEIFTKISEALTEIIRQHTSQDYIPPTTNPTIDISSTEATLITHFLNEVVGGNDPATGYDFSDTANAGGKARAEFIIQRFFLLFSRAQLHIQSAETSEEFCTGTGSRLFYMEIENCLFKLCFTYN